VDGTDAIDRYIGYWARYRDFVDDGRDLPVLDEGLARIERERPVRSPEETLVWGDARFGNMLFDELDPIAAVDFEFSHVGLPGLDVAFFSHFDRISFEYFRPGTRPSGFADPHATFDLYEELTGRRVDEPDWYVLLAATYSALAVTRVMQVRAREGLVPEPMVAGHPSMRALADLLERPL
jgi:aminoglycoside phosphotransferase (APT) family kinase protein